MNYMGQDNNIYYKFYQLLFLSELPSPPLSSDEQSKLCKLDQDLDMCCRPVLSVQIAQSTADLESRTLEFYEALLDDLIRMTAEEALLV